MEWRGLRTDHVRYRFALVVAATVDLVRWIADFVPEEVFGPVLSFLLPWLKTHLPSRFVLDWLVIGGILLQFAPNLFPNRLRPQTNRLAFRASFALFGLAIAFVLQREGSLTSFLGSVLVLTGASGVYFAGFFRIRHGWSLLDSDGRLARTIDGFLVGADLRGELRRYFDSDGWLKALVVVLWMGALGVVFGLPCFFAGLVAVVLESTFPVPDVLLLGSFVLTVVGWDGSVFDLEDRVYVALHSGTRSLKGAILVTFVAVGAFGWATLFAGALSASVAIFSTTILLLARPVVAWDFVGIILLWGSVGIYGFWYWLRQLERLPMFLDGWAGRQSDEQTPTRPPFLTVPPTLGFIVGGGWIVALGDSADFDHPAWFVFAIAWPVLVLFLVSCARWTFRTSKAQSPANEDRAVAAGLVIEIMAILAPIHSERFASGGVHEAVVDTGLLFPLLVVPAIVYLPNVARYGDRYDGIRGYAFPVYLIVIGGTGAIIWWVRSGTAAFGAGVVGVVCFASGLVQALLEHRKKG
ncbi:hypothetical protein [Haladaptatus sp. NG-SE-30]